MSNTVAAPLRNLFAQESFWQRVYSAVLIAGVGALAGGFAVLTKNQPQFERDFTLAAQNNTITAAQVCAASQAHMQRINAYLADSNSSQKPAAKFVLDCTAIRPAP